MARPPRPHTGAGHRRAFGSRARGKAWLRGGANARPALACAGAHVSICSEGTDCNERCSVSHGNLAAARPHSGLSRPIESALPSYVTGTRASHVMHRPGNL